MKKAQINKIRNEKGKVITDTIKYKGSQETTVSRCLPIKGITKRTGQSLRKAPSSKTEPKKQKICTDQ